MWLLLRVIRLLHCGRIRMSFFVLPLVVARRRRDVADEIGSRLYLLLRLRILRRLIMCLEEILQEGFSSGLLVAQSDEPSLVQVYFASCFKYDI
jgi:hypothetical protein